MAISKAGRKAWVLGLMGGGIFAVLSLLPAAWSLEERFGLPLLYELRGARVPPDQAVVIGMDEASVESLGLGSLQEKWPRALHAELVEKLAEVEPAALVFDIFFRSPDAPHTRELAAAFARIGNVILFSYADADTVDGGRGGMSRVEIVPPAPVLADAALASAPFLLPKSPWGVRHFWAVHPAAGDAPSLPLVAWQAYMLRTHPDFGSLLEATCRPRAQDGVAGRCREAFAHDPVCVIAATRRIIREADPCVDELGRRSSVAPAVARLKAIHRGATRRYLNFYGPAGTIPVVPYHEALDALNSLPAARLRERFGGKVIFVGHAEVRNWEQRDAFVTVYSDAESGVDLPGVEIAATAFSNLVDGSALVPVPPLPAAALVWAWGLLVGVVARRLRAPVAVTLSSVMALAYLWLATVSFDAHYLWLPVITPLALELPGLLGAGLLWRYFDLGRAHRAMETAAGFYLPESVVERLATQHQDPGGDRRMTRGVCLATDVAGYTALSEGLDAEALSRLMRAYFSEVFAPVRDHGGEVSDIKGDAMMAVWTADADGPDPRLRAALAALEILDRVERFNRGSRHRLPTRIGLHYGEIILGDVGGGHHFEYRPMGDTVNTASRIEDANKELGTRVLASDVFAEVLNGHVTYRRLGRFLMRGKRQAIGLLELLPAGVDAADDQALRERFAGALALVSGGRLEAAIPVFEEMAESDGDGPASFYAAYLAAIHEGPSSGTWDGLVRLS